MKIIGLLYTGELNVSLFKKYSLSLSKVDKNFRLVAFKPSNLDLKRKRILGYCFANGKLSNKEFELPRSVYNISHNISNQLELKLGKGKVFNLLTKFNKWDVYQILEKSHNQHLLPTTKELSYESLNSFITTYNSVVLKPKTGFQGKGIIRIDNTDGGFLVWDTYSIRPLELKGFQSVLLFLKKNISNTSNYIVQEFIENKKIEHNYFDIRLYVQKNEKGKWQITGGLSRIATRRVFITNMIKTLLSHKEVLDTLYTSDDATKLVSKMEIDSISIAQELEKEIGHLGEISVDFILDPLNRPYVLEVNSQPMKKIVKRINDDSFLSNVYRRPMEYAKYLAMKA